MYHRTNVRMIVCAVIWTLLSLPCAAQVSLVRDGEIRAVVVTADEPSPVARYAVDELLRHVREATGVTLNVMPESNAPAEVHTRIYIGQNVCSPKHTQ